MTIRSCPCLISSRNSAYAALQERVARNAPPIRIPPPRITYLASASQVLIEGGCMFCGVGHQSVSAVMVAQQGRENVARDLWTLKRTGTQQLGGQPSAQWLSGYLCQVCADAVEASHRQWAHLSDARR